MVMPNYPATVIEVLDDRMEFRPAVLREVRSFAESGPWSGTIEERKARFKKLTHDLAVACGVPEPELVFGHLDGSSSGGSHYLHHVHRIVLTGKLSVVTFLHEFGHALGMDERTTCRWSVNLFRRCFPKQFGRLVHVGHTLVRPQSIVAAIGRHHGSNAPRRMEMQP